MRPILYPSAHVTLPPRLCGGIELYVAAWAAGSYGMDWSRRFDKREKGTHRFTIADTRGPLDLTVPIAKPSSSRCRWDEVEISTHGAWWDVHRVALESAYGRTPYFEFYIDRFMPMLTTGVHERFTRLADLANAWDAQIADILGLCHRSSSASDNITAGPLPIAPDASAADIALPTSTDDIPPYRQVRADRLGFIRGLSVLDLIFNLGPEAQLYLHALAIAQLQQHPQP